MLNIFLSLKYSLYSKPWILNCRTFFTEPKQLIKSNKSYFVKYPIRELMFKLRSYNIFVCSK